VFTATAKEFYESDNSTYSQLESSRWLQYVRSALIVAKEASDKLHCGESSVLLRGENMLHKRTFHLFFRVSMTEQLSGVVQKLAY